VVDINRNPVTVGLVYCRMGIRDYWTMKPDNWITFQYVCKNGNLMQ
jgi:hypothetical protein